MMTVRPMTKRDITRVYEIEVQSFRSPWSKLSLLGELHNNVAHYYVAEEEGHVVGYGGGSSSMKPISPTSPSRRKAGASTSVDTFFMA